MNYLAHAYLSFQHPKIMIGNLIADYVKGSQFTQYEQEIQAGIRLHRAIDSFTDQHLLVKECRDLLKPHFRHSAGVFIDIFFDYFLANDTRYFPPDALYPFTQEVYLNLLHHEAILSEPMIHFFSHMKQSNWLLGYQYEEGISRSVHGICKRHPVLGDPAHAMILFQENRSEIQQRFHTFFPELILHTEQSLPF
jgi:acyl carrier protein phosphodiesterase